MRPKTYMAAGACLLALSIAAVQAAPEPSAVAPEGAPDPAQGRGGGRGGGGGRGRGGIATFPAQQRPPGDPALIERGSGLYDVHCQFCHGADLRGGDQGGINLLRSMEVLADQEGELIQSVIQDGRQIAGMPPMPASPVSDADVRALAEYIHSVVATMRGQGNPPAGPPVVLNVLVGDAAAGQAYFNATCTACHSATGDMSGIGTRISDPMQLQNTWVAGGASGRRGGGGTGQTPTILTVTLPSGETVEGTLVRYDDFVAVLRMADGTRRSFGRNGDVPKVEVKRPRQPHVDLLPTYTDKDIHDVTAYLVTLK